MKLQLQKFCLLVGFALLSACNNQVEQAETSDELLTEDTSEVLATVNGENITQADVDFMIERTFSSSDQLFFDDKMQSKVLDSLIASKAMEQQVKKNLSEDQLIVIENKAKAYREELFVKEYLVQNATPEPVSTKIVKDYYDANPEQFGGGESRVFEMLSTTREPSEEARDAILKAVDTIISDQNWAAFAEANDFGLRRKSGTMRPGLLEPALENALKKLKKGETSDMVFVKGTPHLLRVLDVKTLPAQPLSAVSAKIRKKLAAIQLKKAVKKASEDVVKQVNVELK